MANAEANAVFLRAVDDGLARQQRGEVLVSEPLARQRQTTSLRRAQGRPADHPQACCAMQPSVGLPPPLPKRVRNPPRRQKGNVDGANTSDFPYCEINLAKLFNPPARLPQCRRTPRRPHARMH